MNDDEVGLGLVVVGDVLPLRDDPSSTWDAERLHAAVAGVAEDPWILVDTRAWRHRVGFVMQDRKS